MDIVHDDTKFIGIEIALRKLSCLFLFLIAICQKLAKPSSLK